MLTLIYSVAHKMLFTLCLTIYHIAKKFQTSWVNAEVFGNDSGVLQSTDTPRHSTLHAGRSSTS